MFTFTLQYAEAMKIAKKLAHSMSKEETRYYLNGFFMHKAEDKKHYAVSTDGHRLTRIEVRPKYDIGEFPAVIFPAAVIKQILGVKAERSKRDREVITVQVDAAAFKYCLSLHRHSFGGELIEGNYPDYARIIPDYTGFRNEYGQCGFSPVYLAEMFEAASYSEVEYKSTISPVRLMFDGNNPAVALEQKDPSVLYVIMPMRCSMPEHKHPPVPNPIAEAEKATAA